MNWFKKANMEIRQWNLVYEELIKELGRVPTAQEMQLKLQEKFFANKLPQEASQTHPVPEKEELVTV